MTPGPWWDVLGTPRCATSPCNCTSRFNGSHQLPRLFPGLCSTGPYCVGTLRCSSSTWTISKAQAAPGDKLDTPRQEESAVRFRKRTIKAEYSTQSNVLEHVTAKRPHLLVSQGSSPQLAPPQGFTQGAAPASTLRSGCLGNPGELVLPADSLLP